MNKFVLASACSVALVSVAEAAPPADCPSTGDSCVVPSGNDFLDFDYPFGGIFGDNIVLGQLTFPWGVNLVACVNGQVQWSKDSAAYTRSALTQNSVVCTGAGNDTVKVLGAGETKWCGLWGIPLLMGPFVYGGHELAIYGQGGADVITGGDGRDQLCGGSGNDKLYGRGEVNELNGGPGDDDLFGGSDIDYMYGADGDDILDDSAGNGGFRLACFAGGEDIAPSALFAGEGNDCVQLAQYENGWCYQGLDCGGGTDHIDTPAQSGVSCEIVTNGQTCQR